MKKILAALLVLALVAPTMAVTLSGTDLGGGKMRISYDVPTGEVLRGLALNVNTTVGTATIASAAAVTAIEPKFNTFIDYAFSNAAGYAIGAGNPVALTTGAGEMPAASYPVSAFVLSMGALDQAGAQGGVTGAGVLCEIQYNITANATIHVMADTVRGGAVVGDAVTQPTAFDVNLIGAVTCVSKFTGTALTLYNRYITAGKDPSVWCKQFQCWGDADGLEQGTLTKVRVGSNDLGIVLNSWNKKPESGADPRADFDHAEQGTLTKVSVGSNDLGILLNHWNNKTSVLTNCPTYIP